MGYSNQGECDGLLSRIEAGSLPATPATLGGRMLVAALSLVVFVGFLIIFFIVKSKNQEIDDLRNNIDYLEFNTEKVYKELTNNKITEADTPYDVVIKEVKWKRHLHLMMY